MKLAYEAPNWTTANQINLNQTTWRQSKAALSNHHERSALLRHYMVQSGILYQCFGTAYQYQLKGSRHPKEGTEQDRS